MSFDTRRNEIMLGQSINLANAYLKDQESYRMADLTKKKELMIQVADFYYDIIVTLNKNHGLEDKPQSYSSNNGALDKFNPREEVPKKYSSENATNYLITDGQVKFVKSLSKKPHVSVEDTKVIMEKINGGNCTKKDASTFIEKYK